MLTTFLTIKKTILTNLKIPDTLFLLIPFSKYYKSLLTNLKIPDTVFFCLFLSWNIKKRILTNPFTIFCLFLFYILENRILTNLKIPGTSLSDSFFQMLKMCLSKSSNFWQSLFAYSLFQILKKYTYKC